MVAHLPDVTEIRVRAEQLTAGQRGLLDSTAKQVLLAGGYGGGKTTGLSVKLLQLKGMNPHTPGLIVAPTRPLLFSVTVRRMLATIRETCPDLEPKIVDPQNQCYFDFGDGVPVFLRSATRPDSIDGLDVGWALGDEIRYWSRKAYEVTIGRVRVNCALPQKAFASTPAMNWMSEEFNSGKEERELIIAGTVENEHNLAPGFIDNLRQSYSTRMQRAVIHGEFTILEGAVFEAFDPSPKSQWFEDFTLTKQAAQKGRIILSIDPGYRRSAWLFIYERTPMDWVVFDQITPNDMTDMACVEQVNAKGYPIDEVWTDPAAAGVQSFSGLDTVAALRHIETRIHGQRAIRSVQGFARSIAFGVDKLRVLLGGSGDEIRLKFAKSLVDGERHKERGIVKDLASLRYPEMKDGHAITDVPVKDGMTDHTCLTGDTEVFTGRGWVPIESLAGVDGEILTPVGMRPYENATMTRRDAEVYRVTFDDGSIVRATEDHRFLVVDASRYCMVCGVYESNDSHQDAAGFQWASVLQMREILQQRDEHGRPGVFAQGRMDPRPWGYLAGLPCPSCGRGQDQQRLGQPRVHAGAQAFIKAHADAQKAGRLPEEHQESAGRSHKVARVRGGQGVAQEARQGVLGQCRIPRLYMPDMRKDFPVARAPDRQCQILPPQLQDDGTPPTPRYPHAQRVDRIEKDGKADVWCLAVPEVGCFVLRNGVTSKNCDALRYFAVSRWVAVPALRGRDPALSKLPAQGFKSYAA